MRGPHLERSIGWSMMQAGTASASTGGAHIGWLASYPKSGNTWLRMMLHSLQQKSGTLDINEAWPTPILNRTDFMEHFGVESSDLTREEINAVRPDLFRAIARASKQPLLLYKVHDRCWSTTAGKHIFPPDVSRGAICIVRDPRDVAVSFAHHYQLSLEETVRQMGDPQKITAESVYSLNSQLDQPLGSWSEHVTSWLDSADMPVLLLRYEDMLADAAHALARAANFLGISEETTPETFTKAAAASDFSLLRKQEEERGFVGTLKPDATFFRHGRSGEGKQVLPTSLLRRLEADHGAVMARLGYL